MTDTQDSPQETKRDELRAKIEASERRIEERTLAVQAKEAADAATDFVKERPLTVIGGAVAIGLLIGLATKPGRRVARNAANSTANIANTSAKQASRYGTLISDALIAYGIKLIDDAMDAGRHGQDKLEDLGDSAGAKARAMRRDAEYFAGSALDKGLAVTRRTRRKAGRAVRDLKGRVTN